MTKKLVASVAAGALFAGVTVFAPMSFAQETTQPSAQPQTMETPMSGTEQPADAMKKPMDQAAATTPAAGSGYLTEQGADQIAASTYIGQSVYNASDESIGEINDVIFTKDGSVEAAVIGVGGFLGIGEKNVAVPLDTITVADVPNSDDLKLTTAETADTLKAAPEFKTKSQQVAEQNANTPVDTTTTSSTAPAADPAMKPAEQPATNP
ncbi:PRC-barrel domain-containing protein [Rhizobium sp. LjRoot98]|uniref:PRC-barrel domain-containing protein n=1 Tax=unclassified Rhizobium TaxID=2613769 RepID=UPI000714A0F7|nr:MULTISPECIES: PRC-barrel domain-containing protein [unclassified Rhizobium]KQV34114.1 photosystem reaction center subunit H [Rhizobium sp. Root1204]KQY17589.1 photosystem reaction center subunit H [Rhizobium sp. Root1334]KRC13464.1 photosystem reaction center subunit H [Rhizobium sp. Root73]